MGWLDGEAARRGAWRGVGGEYGVAEKSSKISILKRKPHTPYLKIIPSSRLRRALRMYPYGGHLPPF
jgi:hypothetical protein